MAIVVAIVVAVVVFFACLTIPEPLCCSAHAAALFDDERHELCVRRAGTDELAHTRQAVIGVRMRRLPQKGCGRQHGWSTLLTT
eukprot:7391086-Prymnesium_polylepis.1